MKLEGVGRAAVVGPLLGDHLLWPRFAGLFAKQFVSCWVRGGGEKSPPQPGAIIARDLEKGAPIFGMGEIIAGAAKIPGANIEGRGQDEKAFRMRIAFKRDAERLADGRATAVSADEIAVHDRSGAGCA